MGQRQRYTSIQIMPETRHKLARLKGSERETYDSLLNKLLELVPSGDDEGAYTQEFRIGLLNARLEFRKGGLIPHDVLKKQLGLRS